MVLAIDWCILEKAWAQNYNASSKLRSTLSSDTKLCHDNLALKFNNSFFSKYKPM